MRHLSEKLECLVAANLGYLARRYWRTIATIVGKVPISVGTANDVWKLAFAYGTAA